MDPLSITTACVGIIGSITKVSIQITDFVRKAREARGDLDAVSRELVSLKTVLEILSGDARTGKSFPHSLVKQISGILTNCSGVLEQIETSLQKHAGGGIKPAVKWTLSGRDDMTKLRSSLEAHKSALDIALDMVSLSIARDIKADTQEIRNNTSAIKEDTTQILAEIARLQARLPEDERFGGANGFALQRYLDNLTTYAESSWEISDIESNESAEFGTPRGESPSPLLSNVSPGQEPTIIENTVNVHTIRSAEYQAPGKNYNISSSIHTQHQDGKASNAKSPRPDTPLSKAPKLSENVDKILGKSDNMFRRESSSHNEKQTTPPKSFSTTNISRPPINISRPPSVDRASRKSIDSHRSLSFGFRKRISGSLSGSEPTIQHDLSGRFSLLPASFSLKSIGIGKEYGTPESFPEGKSEAIVGTRSNTPPFIAEHERSYIPTHDRRKPQPTPSTRRKYARSSSANGFRRDSSDDDLSYSVEAQLALPRPQLPPKFRQVTQPRERGVLEKNNRKFADAYEEELPYLPYRNTGSSGAAKKVMDFFRRRGKAREYEDE